MSITMLINNGKDIFTAPFCNAASLFGQLVIDPIRRFATRFDKPRVISPNVQRMSVVQGQRFVNRLRELELKCWTDEQAFTHEHLVSHLEVFPHGILAAYANSVDYKDYIPSGWGLVQMMDYDFDKPVGTWYEATDEGFLRKTHNPNGRWLYGVNLSVPKGTKSLTSRIILDAGKNLAIHMGLEGIILGSRIPRYHKVADKMSVLDYVMSGKDPELRIYQRNGFEIATNSSGEAIILPGYFEDPDSCDYGVLIVWRAPRPKKEKRHILSALML